MGRRYGASGIDVGFLHCGLCSACSSGEDIARLGIGCSSHVTGGHDDRVRYLHERVSTRTNKRFLVTVFEFVWVDVMSVEMWAVRNIVCSSQVRY